MTSFACATRALLAAPLLLALLACNSKSEDTAKAPVAPSIAVNEAPASGKPAAATPPAKAPVEEPSAAAKLQDYIGCYNRLDGRAHKSIERYATWVKNMKTGPTGRESVVYGLYETDPESTAKCKTSFATSAAQKPAMPALDAAGAAYIQALDAMDTQVTEANNYYSRDNYKDDKFAKGKAMHAPLVASFEAFQKASSAFSDQLDVENDKVLAAKLADVEKTEGKQYTYYRMALMARAKALVNLLGEEKFDVAMAETRLSAYEALADESLAYAKAHKDSRDIHWGFFESSTEQFRQTAKERFRRVRDKVPYNEGDRMIMQTGSGWMVEGSPQKLLKTYNELVDKSNDF